MVLIGRIGRDAHRWVRGCALGRRPAAGDDGQKHGRVLGAAEASTTAATAAPRAHLSRTADDLR